MEPTQQYPIGKFESPADYNAELLRTWQSAIEALPSWLDVLVQNLDEEQLHRPIRPGAWSIHQIIHHLADSHMNVFIRFKLALTEENPTVKNYDHDAWIATPDVSQEPVNVSITLLHALHRRWLALLRGMTDRGWERKFYNPEAEKWIPLWQATAQYAWHGRHHMEQIREAIGRFQEEGTA